MINMHLMLREHTIWRYAFSVLDYYVGYMQKHFKMLLHLLFFICMFYLFMTCVYLLKKILVWVSSSWLIHFCMLAIPVLFNPAFLFNFSVIKVNYLRTKIIIITIIILLDRGYSKMLIIPKRLLHYLIKRLVTLYC